MNRFQYPHYLAIVAMKLIMQQYGNRVVPNSIGFE